MSMIHIANMKIIIMCICLVFVRSYTIYTSSFQCQVINSPDSELIFAYAVDYCDITCKYFLVATLPLRELVAKKTCDRFCRSCDGHSAVVSSNVKNCIKVVNFTTFH